MTAGHGAEEPPITHQVLLKKVNISETQTHGERFRALKKSKNVSALRFLEAYVDLFK